MVLIKNGLLYYNAKQYNHKDNPVRTMCNKIQVFILFLNCNDVYEVFNIVRS